MTTRYLTEDFIGSLKRAARGERYVVYDSLVAGFAVRITDAGSKTYVFVGRFSGSKNPTRRKIGSFGAIPLDDARKIAREMHADLCRKRRIQAYLTDTGAADVSAARMFNKRAQGLLFARLENETKRHCRIGTIKIKKAMFEKAKIQ